MKTEPTNSTPTFRGGKKEFVPGQVIVKFKDAAPVTVRRAQSRFQSSAVSSVDNVLKRFGAADMVKLFPQAKHKQASKLRRIKAPNGTTITEHNLDKVYSIQLESLNPDSTLRLAAALDSLAEVEYAEPNYIAYISDYQEYFAKDTLEDAASTGSASPASPSYGMPQGPSVICSNPSSNPLYNLQYGLTYEGLPELWKKPVVNGKRPVIAIIDTGVDINHPDLKDNIWTNEKEAEGEPDYDNDGNGFKGDVHGWDFVNNSPNIRDYNSHGTHCAGIAAASDNGIGIVGANPKALIMPVTVMQSDGQGDYATIAKGIDYAVENGATVLSMSLGGYTNSQVLRQALENAYGKAVLVAAAGNDAMAIYRACADKNHPYYGPCFPAAYSFVLGVEALQQDSTLASFSNFDCDGPNYSAETSVTDPEGFNYELMAPGRHIASTIPDGKYRYLSGTSMAAPLVAGAISALEMVKNYDSQEILWGDLTHSSTILEAYNIKQRPAELDFLGMQMRDRKELTDGEIDDNSYATNDGEADAGETLNIYPIIRTTFGAAKNIKLKLEMGDQYEDKSLVDILTPSVDFGMNLTAYGKGVSVNPLRVKLSPNIADARHLKLKIVATADGTEQTFEQPFTITVSNMHKIGGLIEKDTTLTADKTWYVTENIGISQGVTMKIEPGTRLEFATGMCLSSFGKLIAKGTPEKPIIFTKHTGEGFWAGVKTHKSENIHSHPSYSNDFIYTNADTTKFTILRTDETPYRLDQRYSSTYYYKPSNEKNPVKGFVLYNYIDVKKKTEELNRDTTLAKNPSFITTEVLRMLADFKAWNDTCKAKYSNSIAGITNYFSNLISYNTLISFYDNPRDTISFCKLSYCDFGEYVKPYMYDCEVAHTSGFDEFYFFDGERNNFVENGLEGLSRCWSHLGLYNFNNYYNAYNFVNNYLGGGDAKTDLPGYRQLINSNWINSIGHNSIQGKYYGKTYWISINSLTPTVDHADHPSYLGTAREDLVRPYCFEIGNAPETFGKIDLSNMLKEPVHEAHGIVWKVVVDGKDAQDEYEQLAPLGVGKHQFCVWFNRPMNINKAPQISFGVRDPYTQVAVAEDGSWSADSTKYTAYVTITGKTSSDGINQIYVRGAEDNQFFECPYEKTRFRVQVQAAGSMATGFMAEPGLGKVTLTWNNEHNDFADAMGFNVYRISEPYQKVTWNYYNSKNDTIMVADTVRISQSIVPVDSTSFVDYDVVAGKTYSYYYKVLSTDLKEYDISNVVAATVLSSEKGDANGSGAVDVADVITTVNYSIGDRPKPFLFEAADMNSDKTIDVLDVVGIIEKILGKDKSDVASSAAVASYSIENGVLYVDAPVALAGVQVQVNMDEKAQPKPADDLNGFENASAWLSDNDYIFLAYNMNGKTLTPGRHAILNIGNADLTTLCLSDTAGHNVQVVSEQPTNIDSISKRMHTQKGIFSLDGRKLAGDASRLSSLPNGVYIVNGEKVVK